MDVSIAAQQHRRRLIAGWLLATAAAVFVMVVLGGLTRLTNSGLSIVDWRPVTGWLPPLTTTEWEAAFRAYQQFPEYQKLNAGMTLGEFQDIFWLEFIHRLWGRVIGLAFAVPFLVFLVRGWIDRRLGWKLLGAFVLGGLQGVLGWYMVKSGLVDRPDVSQYRLAAHLSTAMVIIGYLLWVALGLLVPAAAPPSRARASARRAVALAALIFITMISGAFVAGLDAGFTYNTFPLMDGRLIPAGLFPLDPAWRSLFEDVTTVQFMHRLLATTTFCAVLAFRLSLRRQDIPAAAVLPVNLLAAWVFVQVGLGIATLLTVVALPLAALHQASAVVLWSLAVWTAFALRRDGALVPRRDGALVPSVADRPVRASGPAAASPGAQALPR